MILEHIIASCEAVGVNAFITNSNEKIETQLNRLQREETSPTMLVSWDIDVTLAFDANGFLENPQASIVALLVSKPQDLTKEEREQTADEMADLFQSFIKDLHGRMMKYQKQQGSPITNASYKLVPKHGKGQHSGVLARWQMRTDVTNC